MASEPIPLLVVTLPLGVVYQSIVQLAGAVALNATIPGPQIVLLLAPVGAAGNG
jgi:hypothetical protein